MTATPTEQDIRTAVIEGDEQAVAQWLRDALAQRDTARGELRFIRDVIGANPEESTYDEVQRVLAGRDQEIKRLHELCERLQQQAEVHAQEARTANATIREIYQVCTGATGEPGNWHGAEPVRRIINELREAKKALRDVRPEIDSLIKGLHHSHVNPSDGLVHDENVAHELLQLTKLHERIVRLLGERGAGMTDGRQYQAMTLREQALEGIKAWEGLYEREKQRAQRAEAECERLREALGKFYGLSNDLLCRKDPKGLLEACADAQKALATPPPEGEPQSQGCERCGLRHAAPADRCPFGDAPHTPEQANRKRPHITISDDVMEVAQQEQAHGDALAALERIKHMALRGTAGATVTVESDAEMVRRHLTASGVPYVPESIRRLPGRMRSAAKEMQAQEPKSGSRLSGRIDEAWVWADELERALASAPAVPKFPAGWKVNRAEQNRITIQHPKIGFAVLTNESDDNPRVTIAYELIDDMIAAAPTDGRE